MCVDLNNDLDNLGDLTWDKVSCDLLDHNVMCSVCNVVTRIGWILQVSGECTTQCVCVVCVMLCTGTCTVGYSIKFSHHICNG